MVVVEFDEAADDVVGPLGRDEDVERTRFSGFLPAEAAADADVESRTVCRRPP